MKLYLYKRKVKAMRDLGNGYVVMTMEEVAKLAREERIDCSKKCKWQCPTCKNRVKNLQREKDEHGNKMWGCRCYCDTLSKSYFNGHACKRYAKGSSGMVWL